MADDRYSRLLAAITARRELAEAACHRGNGIWTTGAGGTGRCTIESDRGLVVYDEHNSTDEQTAHISFNDPAQILRDTAAHLRIVERHAPLHDGDSVLQPWSCESCELPWPCPDWLDVASSYPETEAPSCA